jgi:type II secretion system protein N
MRPLARRFALAAAILVGLLLLAVLALPYLVSLDSLREKVAATAGAMLHRKVEIGTMRLQILTGLGAGVEKVSVANTEGFETRDLATADKVSVKVAFWPLLSRRIEVRKIVLDGVTIAIERAPDGKLNIADFLSAGKRESPPASQAAAAALLVSRIEIARGRALFVDRKVTPGTTVTLALEDLTGRITDVDPKKAARFDLSARFLAEGARNLALAGTLGPPPADGPLGQAPLEATFEAKTLALARLAPYVAAFQKADPGALTVSGRAAGKLLGALEIAGRTALDPSGPASPIPALDGTFTLGVDWGKGTLVVGRSVLEVAALPLSIEGRVDDLHGTPRVDFKIATPGEVAIDDVTGLPGLSGRLPDSVKLSGRVRLEAKVQGPSNELEMTGTLDAAPLGVAMDRQPLLEAPSVHATLASRGKEPLSGRITAASAKLKDVPFERFAADWTWSDGSLTLIPSAGLYGGTLSGRVETSFGKPDAESRLALEIQGVQGQPLVESATTVKGVFAGTLDGTLTLVSRGLGWDALTKTGKGEGRLSVSDADLKTVQLLPEVARTLSIIGKVAGFQVPASLESTTFTKLETSLRLADGRVATPDLTLSSKDVAISADGSLGLDKTLAYRGQVTLAAPVVKSLGSAGRYVADAQGRLSLPFTVSGTVAAPKVAIDERVALELGQRALARQAGEQLGGPAGQILGDVVGGAGATRSATPGAQGSPASAVDLLQQFLGPRPTPSPARSPNLRPTPR